MKPSFEILWAWVAEKDLLEIIDYIVGDDPSTALQILKKIENAAAKLKSSPRRGRVVPELLSIGISQYREILVNPWRVIYKIEEKMVVVVAVIDGRRNVEDILLSRLLR